jgi:hypothetical protein
MASSHSVVVQELLLPPSLRAAPESQRMAIAWAYEAYNVLESERTIMQHRRRQMIFEARSYQLQEEEKLSSAQTIMRDVQQLINLSLSKVSASGFVPERQHPPWSSPHGRNNLPSLSKASAHAGEFALVVVARGNSLRPVQTAVVLIVRCLHTSHLLRSSSESDSNLDGQMTVIDNRVALFPFFICS